MCYTKLEVLTDIYPIHVYILIKLRVKIPVTFNLKFTVDLIVNNDRIHSDI